jgi:hypothetical protein
VYEADVGKSIALPGSSVSSVAFGAHSIVIVTNLGTTTFSNVSYATGEMPTYYTVSTDPTGLERVTFACYVAVTRIATTGGETPVECLAIGDEVFTASGETSPVKFIGWRELHPCRYRDTPDVHPVRIKAGAFGAGLPRRDLLLSPEHAIFVDGVLVPARCLVGCKGIRIESSLEQITYCHIELPRHDVILAEGLPCESWLDTGNRDMFLNAPVASLAFSERSPAPTAEAAWATKACAELVTDGPVLEAIRARLGGGMLQTAAINRVGKHRIAIEPGATGVRLLSPVGQADGDSRSLGAAITLIALDGEPVALTDLRLTRGFHAAEAAWRWTSGTGVIALDAAEVVRTLDIEVVALAFQQDVAA